ncbi:unnamed protein product [Ceutorhynchus assimilis]|uniref:Regulatory protein zeste n=1 Tax=Ceutorhynchus assimilis TaxID=467358 RepID=A0A9N9N0K1_9CUCU|nr:unnamed protein product [Ceutorhynchus assimilis]
MPPKKANPEQYKKLVDLVWESDVIRWGKGTPDMKKEAWQQISETLNCIGGAEKTAEGWKKAFIEWKSHIKAKIRCEKPLTEIEKKCANMTGLFISCTGIANIPELGLKGQPEEFTVKEDGFLEKYQEFSEVPTTSEELPETSQESPEESPETVQEENLEGNNKAPSKVNKGKLTLLEEHVNETSKGLLEIAKSILAVADSINNLAVAVNQSNKTVPNEEI